MNILRRTHLTGLLLALLCAAARADGGDRGLKTEVGEQVRALTQAIVARGHAPGAVIDVRCHGQPWLQDAFGLADVARARLLRPDHVFRIYSMSKPLTSLLVLMLAEEGRLSIDDPVSRHLREFTQVAVHDGSQVFPPQTLPVKRAVTVRDLLRHTAGLTYLSPLLDPVTRLCVQRGIDHGGGNRIVPADGSAPIENLAEFSRRIAALPLMAQPGSRFTYGNATDVLGRLVEVVTGKPLREVVTERLLLPLGMHDTGFQVTPEQLGRFTAAYSAPSLAEGGTAILRRADMSAMAASRFTLADDPQTSVFASQRPVEFGGAGLVSTAPDYQRFLRFLLRRGEHDGVRLVRRDTIAAMTLNQVDPSALRDSTPERSGLGFGLGFATFLHPESATAAVPPDGYFWGGAASTYFWVDPERGITVVLLTQVFGGDVAPYFTELMDLLYRLRP